LFEWFSALRFIKWLAYRSVGTDTSFVKKRDKVIYFNKNIVNTIFGFANGGIPFTMSSNDHDIELEVEELRRQYRAGKKFPVQRLESVMMSLFLLGASFSSSLLLFCARQFPTI
jgi:hypothetical protein